jgi:cobalt/nickel transport system permease protein
VLHVAVDLVSVLRRLTFVDSTPAETGFCGRLTPTAHLLGTLGLLLAAALTRSAAVLAGLLALVCLLAWLSQVPLRLLAGRITPIVGLSAVVVAPQLILMNGQPLATVGGVTITLDGLAYVTTFLLRVGVSVAAVTLLLATTRFTAVTGAIRGLGVPHALVTVLEVTYRYLGLSTRDLHAMLVARRSRGGGRGGLRASWRDLTNLSGTFFLRSLARGERVERAATARGGGRGAPGYPSDERAGPREVAFLAIAVAAVAVAGVSRWGPL